MIKFLIIFFYYTMCYGNSTEISDSNRFLLPEIISGINQSISKNENITTYKFKNEDLDKIKEILTKSDFNYTLYNEQNFSFVEIDFSKSKAEWIKKLWFYKKNDLLNNQIYNHCSLLRQKDMKSIENFVKFVDLKNKEYMYDTFIYKKTELVNELCSKKEQWFSKFIIKINYDWYINTLSK